MDILTRLEDKYGCRTLLEYSNSILTQYDMLGNFGNSGVFQVTEFNNDYIVLIFDMDDEVNMSLTGDKLKRFITTNIDSQYWNKVVLIPVYFCYETLVLYSSYLQELIKSIEKEPLTRDVKFVKIYKEFYDYSKICPDNLYGIEQEENGMTRIEKIQNEVAKITGQNAENDWLPQTFHLSYSASLLRHYFRSYCYASSSNQKKFKKKEHLLFPVIEQEKGKYWIDDIIQNIISHPGRNTWFAKILEMQNINELQEMTLDITLGKICEELDDYNNHIMGISGKINMCQSNLETYIEMGKKSVNNMIKRNQKEGFEPEIIEKAIEKLLV